MDFTALVVREAKKKVQPEIQGELSATSPSAPPSAGRPLQVDDAGSRQAQTAPSKKRKLFDFMSDPTPTPTGAPQQHDVSRDFQRFLDSAQIGLEVFNDPLFSVSLRPIAMQLFSAPCSSAASERVFSQAGLVMRPTKSRLSKCRLSQLVFLKCNEHLC